LVSNRSLINNQIIKPDSFSHLLHFVASVSFLQKMKGERLWLKAQGIVEILFGIAWIMASPQMFAIFANKDVVNNSFEGDLGQILGVVAKKIDFKIGSSFLDLELLVGLQVIRWT
jgi:hypothetical protein